jgi:catechol 2,3-dioxygenase-like lactoylglutathione lyase family enzyme
MGLKDVCSVTRLPSQEAADASTAGGTCRAKVPLLSHTPTDGSRGDQERSACGRASEYHSRMDSALLDARMIAMLPCADIDRTAEFWRALGMTVTYRQLRPNPYLALERGGVVLHYYGLEGLDPDKNHSTCGIVVDDTEPLHRLFTEGLAGLYGRAPLSGLPRITRPRRRANNGGLSGFSVVDLDGNWIRVSRRPIGPEEAPRTVDDRIEWVSQGGGPVARALENAVVMADSHGVDMQAERLLVGALARNPDASPSERAAAWAYLGELRVRLGDANGAREAAAEVGRISTDARLTHDELEAVAEALRDVQNLGF